jgi:4-amino-4-deoxy-L-arabinose transferase-like glycosyltransferase
MGEGVMRQRGARSLSVSVLLAAIIALAAAVRFWGLGFGLPHSQTRPDETQIIDVTLYFLRGDFKPPFYDYPWLYMWVLTALYMAYYVWGLMTGAFASVGDLVASWPVNWEPFFLINRGLSASAGVATVYIVYRLARKLWDEPTGLVAALFLALTFIHVRDSHFGTTDIFMTLFIVGSVSVLVTAHLTRRPALFAVAGLLGGLATATKYNGAFLIAPLVASQLLHVFESPGQRLRAALDLRVVWFGLPFAAALAVGVPFVVADDDRFWAAMRDLSHSMRHGQGAVTPDNGWLHHLGFSLRYGMSVPLLAAGLAGAAIVSVRQPRIAVLLLSFPITYFVVAGSFRNLFFRYMIPVVPFLVVTAAWLVVTTVRRLSPSPVALALAAAVLAIPSALSTWRFDRIVSARDNRVLVADWFAEHVRPGDSVLQSGSIYGYAQLDTRIWVPWTWNRNRRIFMVRNQPAEGRPDWILVQDSPLPSMTQDIVKDFLREDYEFAWQFTAFSPAKGRVYDLQDAFFVPFAGFDGVQRPGPNFTLYKRSTGAFRKDEARSEP